MQTLIIITHESVEALKASPLWAAIMAVAFEDGRTDAQPMTPVRCTIRDGKFVVPCAVLADAVGGAVAHAHYVNMSSGQPSRSYFVLKSGAHKSNGVAMNVCPFCGEWIDAPFSDESAASAA